MKKLIALAALALSVSSFAAEKVSFTYSGFEGYGRSYYSCDYVEAQTEKYLELFGATQIDVTCFGGIEFGRMSPVSITARLEVPALQGNEVATEVKVEGDRFNPSCGVNVAIIKNILPKFSNVEVLKKSDSCAFASSNYSYTFSIKK